MVHPERWEPERRSPPGPSGRAPHQVTKLLTFTFFLSLSSYLFSNFITFLLIYHLTTFAYLQIRTSFLYVEGKGGGSAGETTMLMSPYVEQVFCYRAGILLYPTLSRFVVISHVEQVFCSIIFYIEQVFYYILRRAGLLLYPTLSRFWRSIKYSIPFYPALSKNILFSYILL